MVQVTPGGISGALSLGAHCHTEVKIRNVWVNFHDGAEHTALRLMVLPVATNQAQKEGVGGAANNFPVALVCLVTGRTARRANTGVAFPCSRVCRAHSARA